MLRFARGQYYLEMDPTAGFGYLAAYPPLQYYSYVDADEVEGPVGNESESTYIELMNRSLPSLWTMVVTANVLYEDRCRYPLVCGNYGLCKTCQSLWDLKDKEFPDRGCKEVTPLTCHDPSHHHLVELMNVSYIGLIYTDAGINDLEQCKQASMHAVLSLRINDPTTDFKNFAFLKAMKWTREETIRSKEYLEHPPTRYSYKDLRSATDQDWRRGIWVSFCGDAARRHKGCSEVLGQHEAREEGILDREGLQYLHEECLHKIAHLDVKPHNILMDESFNAKISYFGLSKLIAREQSLVVTTLRGTIGYLAPARMEDIQDY
ncbi:hypothetical protein AMTR_s00002p00262980 [Amborella trichopoda]|uniref:Protein kinase domain-containing protein n=1 Tax=Amborella trichopoda TaxID=13333 RepID=W1P165_AMBTC|nr:hypothetical protein AMTR_s00002p00262980 [Amborella trichopoda]